MKTDFVLQLVSLYHELKKGGNSTASECRESPDGALPTSHVEADRRHRPVEVKRFRGREVGAGTYKYHKDPQNP